MISRAQGKALSADIAVRKQLKLSGVEKAMLKWVVVDPEDKLLDANIGNGMMAEYLRRNMQCEVCGVSDNMEHVREARSRLQNCDIVYAALGDMPWRGGAFDTVLMRYNGEEAESFKHMLTESARVLKAGGQLILGAVCYPAPVQMIADLFAPETEEEHKNFDRAETLDMLCGCGFEKMTWQRTGLGTGVLIAWKQNPEVNELRKAE